MSNATLDHRGAYELTRFNALRHGVLSRYAVLPWEESADYDTLLGAIVAEHRPQGPTEEHLVEELTGIIWRKRRLRQAEAATFRHGLSEATRPHRRTKEAALVHHRGIEGAEGVRQAIVATAADQKADLAQIEKNEVMARHAIELLGSSIAYTEALAALDGHMQGWWEEKLGQDGAAYSPDTESLRRFLETVVVPALATVRAEIANRPLIKEQAIGEAFDPNRLDRLARYEVHLDRKLERMLTMLVRLKELRGLTVEG